MLDGKKPLAVFYRDVKENFDETNGQDFKKFVKSKKILRNYFFIYNHNRTKKLIYSTYSLPGEEWRAMAYKLLKKTGQVLWSKDMESIEGILLGYSEDENFNHIKTMYR